MKTFLKIITLLAAAAGVVLLVMKLLEADKRSADDKKHIAMFKGKFSLPTRKSGDLKSMADQIADFRDGGDDEDAYLFEDICTDTELSDDDKYADIFAEAEDAAEEISEAVEEIAEDAAKDAAEDSDDEDDISEDSLAQLLDS